MLKNWPLFATLSGLLVAATAAWAQTDGAVLPDPTGQWLVAKAVAQIRIVNCAERFWGVVSWEAQPGIDRHNPDPRQRTRPTLGMPILLGMAQTQPNRWEGEIYNSEDGHTYSANISLQDPNTLRVQGCFLAILCGGENWTRVQPTVAPAPPPVSRKTGGRPAKSPSPPPGSPAETDADVCLRLSGLPGLAH